MKNQNIRIDSRLRQRFQSELEHAPENPWFIRKVMNRLPERPAGRRAAALVRALYALGVAALIFGWGYAVNETLQHGLTLTSIILAVTLPVTTLIGVAVVAIPAIRRSL